MIKIVHNKLLGGWYVVRGPHHTPLGGRFNTKAEAKAWLTNRKDGARFKAELDTRFTHLGTPLLTDKDLDEAVKVGDENLRLDRERANKGGD